MIKLTAFNLDKRVSPGLYCSGWVKTGPTGVIATTMNNSFDTARSLMDDMDSGTLDVSVVKPGAQSIRGLLETRGTVTAPSQLPYSSNGLLYKFCQHNVDWNCGMF